MIFAAHNVGDVLEGVVDYDLLNAAYVLGVRSSDWNLAIDGLETRNRLYPEQALDGWLKMGAIYATNLANEPKALEAYRKAMAIAPDKEFVRKQLPVGYQAKL